MGVVDDGRAVELHEIFGNLGVGGGEVKGRGEEVQVKSRGLTGQFFLPTHGWHVRFSGFGIKHGSILQRPRDASMRKSLLRHEQSLPPLLQMRSLPHGDSAILDGSDDINHHQHRDRNLSHVMQTIRIIRGLTSDFSL